MTEASGPAPGHMKHLAVGSDWQEIAVPATSLYLEPRQPADLAAALAQPQELPQDVRIGHGAVDAAMTMLGPLPAPLAQDIATLAYRFARLAKAGTVRIRLECVTGNSCRRLHADRTDLRLITTYMGPGTQVAAGRHPGAEEDLWSVPTGWVGIYKGALFGEGHHPCYHRSPPAGDMGVRRLVLVIDSPRFANGAWQDLQAA